MVQVEQPSFLRNTTKASSKRKAGKVTLILKPGTNKIEIRKLGKRGINFGYIDLKPVK